MAVPHDARLGSLPPRESTRLGTGSSTERTGFGKNVPMGADELEIRRLASADVAEQLDALAGVLVDCVAGGASVSYLAPFSHEQARAAFEAVAAEVEQVRRHRLGAWPSDPRRSGAAVDECLLEARLRPHSSNYGFGADSLSV
jgi:hypothetical protein